MGSVESMGVSPIGSLPLNSGNFPLNPWIMGERVKHPENLQSTTKRKALSLTVSTRISTHLSTMVGCRCAKIHLRRLQDRWGGTLCLNLTIQRVWVTQTSSSPSFFRKRLTSQPKFSCPLKKMYPIQPFLFVATFFTFQDPETIIGCHIPQGFEVLRDPQRSADGPKRGYRRLSR